MPFYLAAAATLAAATILALWTAMRWPNPRADVPTGLLGGAAVTLWFVFNGEHPGPTIGDLPLTAADVCALPALLGSALLMGRTALLRNHPYPPAPAAAPRSAPTAAHLGSDPEAAPEGNDTAADHA